MARRTTKYPGQQQLFNARWEPRKRALQHLGSTVRYLARSGLEKGEPSRMFYSADGREMTELEAKREIRECCEAHGYTYTFVASSRWAQFEPDDIHQAMQAGNKHVYYFTLHETTDHPHAHIVSFEKGPNTIGRHYPLDEIKDRWTERLMEREHEQVKDYPGQRDEPQADDWHDVWSQSDLDR
jgi:hypothetical protein